jgi:Rrf2 family transcriptional regulator, iron-sulfur cluster assembly transcription factor
MSSLLSKSSIYALRASLYMATLPPDEYVPVHDIAEKLGISFHFLAKILQALTHRGILKSFRGPHGGVALARPADDVSLEELIEAVDGQQRFEGCLMGLPGCGEERPCPLHEQWEETQKSISRIFTCSTLGEQARRIKELDLRLH